MLQTLKGQRSSVDNINLSKISRTKKLMLTKNYKNQTVSMNCQYASSNIQMKTLQNLEKDHKFISLSHDFKNQLINSTNKDNFKTNLSFKQKGNINIFTNKYSQFLGNGYTKPYKDRYDVLRLSQERNVQQKPSYPVYLSKIQQQQINIQPKIKKQQQIYKVDISPKLKKYKIRLKRYQQSLNPQCPSSSPKQSLQTQQSQSSLPSIQSISINPISLSLIKSTSKTSKNIPQLKKSSNLYQSIRIYQHRQGLIRQIQEAKIQQVKSYQKRNMDKYELTKNQHLFRLKVQYNTNTQPLNTIKSQFITNIQSGKYQNNFKFRQKLNHIQPLKGKNKLCFSKTQLVQQQ